MELKLPNSITSDFDITRLLRELSALEEFFTAAAARPAGAALAPPRLSRMLDQLARENGVNLLDIKQRAALRAELVSLNSKAPRLHISFAADPSPRALERIVIWLRENIHPQVLLQVGLQPNIAAGCVLRTTNRWFDMSLRSSLEKQHGYLIELIAGANGER